jgi:hypothetical protein
MKINYPSGKARAVSGAMFPHLREEPAALLNWLCPLTLYCANRAGSYSENRELYFEQSRARIPLVWACRFNFSSQKIPRCSHNTSNCAAVFIAGITPRWPKISAARKRPTSGVKSWSGSMTAWSQEAASPFHVPAITRSCRWRKRDSRSLAPFLASASMAGLTPSFRALPLIPLLRTDADAVWGSLKRWRARRRRRASISSSASVRGRWFA